MHFVFRVSKQRPFWIHLCPGRLGQHHWGECSSWSVWRCAVGGQRRLWWPGNITRQTSAALLKDTTMYWWSDERQCVQLDDTGVCSSLWLTDNTSGAQVLMDCAGWFSGAVLVNQWQGLAWWEWHSLDVSIQVEYYSYSYCVLFSVLSCYFIIVSFWAAMFPKTVLLLLHQVSAQDKVA